MWRFASGNKASFVLVRATPFIHLGCELAPSLLRIAAGRKRTGIHKIVARGSGLPPPCVRHKGLRTIERVRCISSVVTTGEKESTKRARTRASCYYVVDYLPMRSPNEIAVENPTTQRWIPADLARANETNAGLHDLSFSTARISLICITLVYRYKKRICFSWPGKNLSRAQ